MKAMLVFDMPATCTDCPCYDYIHGVCANTHKDCELRIQEKPTWCPARPLPEKKETRHAMQYRGLAEEYRKEGWNECLDAITGGKE